MDNTGGGNTPTSTTSVPASNPTGTLETVPSIRWFTEIDIPSLTPSGV
jgi:hypothetical protein